MKPLESITVLEFSTMITASLASMMMAEQGARVIKVEPYEMGDPMRYLGAKKADVSALFANCNRGKEALRIDLKSEEGQAVIRSMIANVDVVIHNFRPGVMDRLGLSYPTLKTVNPALIYCAISGFGQDGPWVERPAYDQIIQGASGLMSVTGDSTSAPIRVGSPVADTVGGLTAAMAISAALNARPRGCMIDVSMLESLLATMGWVLSNHLIGGQEPAANGNENPTSAPSGTFQTGDGLLNIAANKDEQWIGLCQHLDREDLSTHPHYRTREDRKANRHALRAELETSLAHKSAQVWEGELNALGIPAGAVLTVPQVLQSEHLQGRDFLEQFSAVAGIDRAIDVVSTGVKIDGTRPKVTTPPPILGADEAEVWGALGYDDEQLELLRKDGVI